MLGLGIRSTIPPWRSLVLYEVSGRRSVAFVVLILPLDYYESAFSIVRVGRFKSTFSFSFSFSNDFDSGDFFLDVSDFSTSSYS